MTRDQALKILHDNMESPNLRKHCYAVAAVMKALAERLDGNPQTWEIAGLLHDADYEKSKDNIEQHTKLIFEWLESHEVEGEIKEAILAHGWGFIEGNPEPKNKIEWSLYCCDELTGFIIAVTLIRPEKKLSAITVENVLGKWKEKSFASGVHREQIELCEEKLNIPLQEFILIALTAMQGISEDLGL
jgi:uncharacterized protein